MSISTSSVDTPLITHSLTLVEQSSVRAPSCTYKLLALLYCIAPSIPLTVCTYIYDVSGWMIIAGIIISEIIMVIRVWALWQFSRVVGALLLVMAILGIGVTSISYVKFSDEISFIDMNAIPLSLNLNGCFPAFGSNIVFLAFVSLFVWETLVMVLLLSKGAQHFRHVSRSFLRTVYQDGVLYYGVMVVVSCMNVVILLTWPVEGANLLTPYATLPPTDLR
ncbi:hypothetical protein EYR36_005777 [Pleurotus pulmonarius]|nr:hypothetical protein EYR36_005777 [Pleurotus pulmonarius]